MLEYKLQKVVQEQVPHLEKKKWKSQGTHTELCRNARGEPEETY